MEPNLLMRAWMMAHLHGAKYQAVVCLCGSNGEAAFRESLSPQYTSERHDAKGLRTFYVYGTYDGGSLSRITSNRELGGIGIKPLSITVTSNTRSWTRDDLAFNYQLESLNLQVERLAKIPSSFLLFCHNLQHVDLASLHAVEKIGNEFLAGCSSLKEVDLTPLTNVKMVVPEEMRLIDEYQPRAPAQNGGNTVCVFIWLFELS